MEPKHNNYASSPELPQPQEMTPQTEEEQSIAPSPETRGKQAPVGAPAGQQLPVSPLPTALPQALPANHIGVQAGQSQAPGALIADDSDLIEKEWVTKAKAIVAATRNDPHLQNNEINKVKADYLKKRYNKDIKVNEN